MDVEISIKDASYPWFLHWMTAHQQSHLQNNFLGSRTGRIGRLWHRLQPRIHHLSIKTDVATNPNGSVQTRFLLVPGPGKHILRYRNAFFMVERVRETKSMELTQGRPWETITLTTLYSQRDLIENMFTEAHRLAQQATEGKTVVYTSRGVSWEQFGLPRKKRLLNTVILEDGVKERVVEDVKEFLASDTWYHDRGIPYRRGYLLHGSPGSGKSSFIQALAADLDYNIAMLNLSERGLTDDRLNHLLTIVPPRTLVLLEDADSAFGNRRTQTDIDGYRGANVTFSGLLNALDGVSSAEERLLFLTTNHVERLDAALVRPGRIDMTIEIGAASKRQAERLWDRFYGESDKEGELRARFLQRLEESGLIHGTKKNSELRAQGISMATLQGLFLCHKNSMQGAISSIPDLKGS